MRDLKGDRMRFLILFLFTGLILNAADTKHLEMDYGDALFMSLETNSPESENIVRKAIVQKLATQALPDRGTPIGKGRVIKVKDAIEGTELDDIYKYQRERSTGYLIAVPKGEYKVTLQFAGLREKIQVSASLTSYFSRKSLNRILILSKKQESSLKQLISK